MNSVSPISSEQKPLSVNRHFLAFLCLLIIPLTGLCVDIYIPSLPAVTTYFHTTPASTQLSITVYMLGLGIMQLFAGPIADSFGRRKPYLFAMTAYILATLMIPHVTSIYQLLALRVVQGMLVALVVVPLRSVGSDLFEGKEYYTLVNYMTLAWSIGPIVAPAIGGYLQHYFGWQSNFYFLAIYSMISLLLNYLFLIDTSRYHHAFHLSKIISNYKIILLNPIFISALLLNGLLYSSEIIFSIVGPFLIQNTLHYSAIQFGHIGLLLGVAWFTGSILNRLTINASLTAKSKICLWLILAVVGLAAFIDLFITMNIYIIIIPTLIMLVLAGTIFPTNFARAVSQFPEISGSANALFGGFTFIIVALTTALATLLKSSSEIPLMLSYIFITILCLIVFYVEQSKFSSKNIV